MKVDVAIHVYGKPQQTAVTLLTLLQHSGQWIDRIWFVAEREQPFGARFDGLMEALKDRVELFRPAHWLGVEPVYSTWRYRFRSYRHSVRYQYAWERSQKEHLFITHNDVLYSGDVVGAMLERSPGRIAVGHIGQCWNCPAHAAAKCGSTSFMQYRPSYAEVMHLARAHHAPRAAHYTRAMDPRMPWPLPECRVNEWTALIDLRAAKPITIPFGKAVPLGALHGLDTGTQWFHDVVNMGCSVAHMDPAPFARHAWASATGGGHAALADKAVYAAEEQRAADHLRIHFPEVRC
jgi:hypothetical protein